MVLSEAVPSYLGLYVAVCSYLKLSLAIWRPLCKIIPFDQVVVAVAVTVTQPFPYGCSLGARLGRNRKRRIRLACDQLRVRNRWNRHTQAQQLLQPRFFFRTGPAQLAASGVLVQVRPADISVPRQHMYF